MPFPKMVSKKMDRMSVLIVTWDGDALLKNCFDSFIRVYGVLPRIVVVDNANLTSTRNLVAQYANTTYVPSETNLGFSGGNNLGLPYCSGDYVLLLNNDTELREDSISPLIDFLDEHASVAAAQGKVVNGNDPTRLDYCGLQLTPIGHTAAPGLGESIDDGRYNRSYPVFAAFGAFLLIRLKALADIGGVLFRDIFRSYYEDVDLCQRFWMCGYETWYCATPPILHYGSKTSRRFQSAEIAEQGYCNRWYSLLMSYNALGLLYLGFMLFSIFALHAFVSLIKGRSDAMKTQFRVFRTVASNWRSIGDERRRFLPRRTVSDLALFRRVMVRQPWSYYFRLAKT